jgi:hypothetical protein
MTRNKRPIEPFKKRVGQAEPGPVPPGVRSEGDQMLDGNEAMAFITGCSEHGLPHCLCDVQPLSAGVPITTVPFAERLLELGLTRRSFVTWAEEIAAWQDSQTLQLAVDC